MLYSLPYIFILTFFSICAFLYEKSEDENRKRYITITSIAVFFIFFAFRGYVYSDWTSYSELLDKIEWEDLFTFTNEKHKAVVHEPGFTLLCLLCKSLINEYAFLVIVITTINTFLFIRFLRRWKIDNIAFVFMLFIAFEGLMIMFNLLRNAISIFIFLNALEFIAKRKPLQYFSICAIALCFHLSSILFFPLYFFLHKKTNKWVFLGLFFIFFIFYISNISIFLMILQVMGIEGVLGDKAQFYTEALTSSRALSPTGTMEKVGLVALVFLYYDEIILKYQNRIIIINSLLIYFFMYYILGEFKELSSRLSDIFVFSYWVLWIDVVKILYIDNNKKLLAGLIYLYCIYMLTLNINAPIQEYDNLLLGGKTQQERQAIFNKTFETDD